MKKNFIFFTICILFFLFPLSVFAADENEDENDRDWSYYVALLLAHSGWLMDTSDIGVIESLGDGFVTAAYALSPEEVTALDVLYGDGQIAEAEYYDRICSLLFEQNHILEENGSYVFSEEFCAAVLDYIETSDILDYKVCYTISCFDVSSANWTNLAQWNVMTNAASAKLDGNGDSQSFLNPDFPVDSQVYAVGRNTAAGQLVFANVSGLSFVCTSSSQFQSVLDCNFKGTGFDYSIGRVNFYDASGATASVEQYDYFYPYDTALKYNSMISSWTIRYRNNDGGYYFNYFVDGGTERQPILFFENVQALNEYISGQSPVYQIPSDYQGGDMVVDMNIDYRELYDAISAAIATGDYLTATEIQKAVEEAASEYLDRIAQNTADINDALRDQEGNSWLRRISGALDDLAENFRDYSSNIMEEVKSGFAWIKTELAAILAVGIVDFVWEEVEEDFSAAKEALVDVATLAGTKFPLCIPADIVAIISIFDVEPVPPDFNIPFKFLDFEYEIPITVDVELVQPFIDLLHIFVKLLYLLCLVFLSIPMLTAIKEAV